LNFYSFDQIFKNMQVAIIGFGETGSCITSLIIHQFSNIKIHVLDPAEDVCGRLLDMQHAAAFRNIEIILNHPDALAVADYIFYCAGSRNAKDGDRISVTQQNKELIEVIFGDAQLKSSAKIIVVTNPVELITTWISEYFNHKISVVGTGTLLDTYRLKFLISRTLNVFANDIEIAVLGEHGQGMTPLFSRATVKSQLIQTLMDKTTLAQLTQELKDSAKNIRLTEEATKYGVSECALVLMNQFERTSSVRTIASTPVSEEVKQLLAIESSIFFSQECIVSKNGIEIQPLNQVSAIELNQLKAAAKRLEEVYNAG
jgi:L-lactate dehydrogenase